MGIVGALDLHRSQITYQWQDLATGEVHRGRIVPGAREPLRAWLAGLEGADAHFALEATTGWRFVVEELERAGCTPHLGDPAEISARRGPKRRAKTDRADCEHMTALLLEGRLPECWIPPPDILEARTLSRLRKALVDERRQWMQRIHAQLYHQGAPAPKSIATAAGRARIIDAELSPAGRRVLAVGLAALEHIEAEVSTLDGDLAVFARRHPGCRALRTLYGIGPITSVAILTELGDCRRFSSSDHAVRYAGLDVTVYESNDRRAPGHLSRQGPEVLRWPCTRPPSVPLVRLHPTTPPSWSSLGASGTTGRACPWLESCAAGRTTSCGSWETTSLSPPARLEGMDLVRALPVLTVDAPRSAPALRLPPQPDRGRPKKTERPHPAMRVTRSTIMSPGTSPSTEISLGARAHGSFLFPREAMPLA